MSATATPTIKVGIISKNEHLRGLLKKLQDYPQFECVKLDGDGKPLPPSLDVAIVRPCSVAHTATERALTAACSAGLPLVWARGVTRAIEGLLEFERTGQGQDAPDEPEMTLQDAILTIVSQGGFFYSKMLTDFNVSECMSLFWTGKLMPQNPDVERLLQALEVVAARKYSSIPSTMTAIRGLPRGTRPRDVPLYALARNNIPRNFNLMVTTHPGAEELKFIAAMMGFFTSKSDARRAIGAKVRPFIHSEAARDVLLGCHEKGLLGGSRTQPQPIANLAPEPEPEVTPTPEPSPVDPQEELASLFEMLRDQMDKMGLFEASGSGLHARSLLTHFAGMSGVECAAELPEWAVTSSKLSAVTCEKCKATQSYQIAAWALANAEA